MSREIKFRAWCISKAKYIAGFNMFGFSNFAGGDKTLKRFDVEWPSDDYILEQYTGLIDKNGVDAYENDKARFKVDGKYIEGIIKYETCYYVLTGYGMISRLINKGCDFEVIGNIHQNKELL